ncbi:MAG: phosphoribosyltransferase [Candidatus Aquicultor sp.]
MFRDRVDAGLQLARRLEAEYRNSDAIVLAIARGGVVVGDQVAKALHLRLDIIIPRKIGAPGNPELAIGAVAKGAVMLNEPLIRELNIPRSYIDQEVSRQISEIDRRRRLYLGDKAPLDLTGATVILVDDGLATGYTALASVNAVKMEQPKKIVLAVPVAPTETCQDLREHVDEIICLEVHELFFAVGQFYEVFEQTSDSEVIDILNSYR